MGAIKDQLTQNTLWNGNDKLSKQELMMHYLVFQPRQNGILSKHVIKCNLKHNIRLFKCSYDCKLV